MSTLLRQALLVIFFVASVHSPLFAAEPAADKNKKPVRDPAAPEVVDVLKENKGKGDLDAVNAAVRVQQEANAAKRSERGNRILKALDKNGDGKLDLMEAQNGVAAARAIVPGAGQAVADLFDKLDLNHDGYISNDEFLLLIKQMGPAGKLLEPKLAEIFNTLDINHDVRLSFAEAQTFAEYLNDQIQTGGQNSGPKIDKDAFHTAFQKITDLDRNSDGMLSLPETNKDKDLHRNFRAIDTNGDGLLSVDEIYNFYKPQAPVAAKK